MDRGQLPELLAHYVAMFLVVGIVMNVIWTSYGRQKLWVEFGVVGFLCVLYVMVVREFGIAPSSWQPD